MKYTMNEEKRLAIVYCTHADQESEEQQQTLKRFIADCRDRKIFVCVFNSLFPFPGNVKSAGYFLFLYHDAAIYPDTACDGLCLFGPP